jgi:hypothetical protein
MIKGLKTGNAALVAAAADEMHANAADVGGNNVSVNGTPYNTDGVTAADVLGTPAGNLAATAPATPTSTVVAHTAIADFTHVDPAGLHDSANSLHGGHSHFGHLWG